MMRPATRVRRDHRSLAFGSAVWLVVAGTWAADVIDLTLVRLLLALALLVVAPLALDLIAWRDPRAEGIRLAARSLMVPGGVAALVALLLPTGLAGGVFALAWFGVCAAVGLSGLLELSSDRRPGLITLVRVAACAYLGFGAGWLVLSRLDIRPLDFSDAIVELTAVHFHFTGFGAVLIAATAAAYARRRTELRFAMAASLGIVASMPVIAIGITFTQSLQTIGSNLLGLAMVSLVAANALLLQRGDLTAAQKPLLAISSLSILAGMALAIQWALGLQFGTPSPSIDQMAKTHGVLNSLGFVLCGLLVWHGPRKEREP
jgi:hypothetical protein